MLSPLQAMRADLSLLGHHSTMRRPDAEQAFEIPGPSTTAVTPRISPLPTKIAGETALAIAALGTAFGPASAH